MAAEASTFGTQLRRFREAAALSQEELAERAGLTVNAIGALERGERRRPYPHTVHLLAQALELDDERRAALIAAIPKRGPSTSPSEPASFSPVAQVATIEVPTLDGALRRVPGVDVAPPPAELASRPDLGHRSVTFVGRERELRTLRAKLAEASSGHGGIVMLAGEAGIGKTCLAREFAVEATSQGVLCLWGCCFEGDWQPPYGPWVEVLSAYVRGRSPDDLRRALGPGASLIARLVPELHLALRGVPVPSPLSPDEERFRLYDAVIRFLLAISDEQPVLLVLDDLHWADSDSLRLLRHLGRFVGQARLLILGAYRDPEVGLDEHPLMGTLSVLRRESGYERIVIKGFDRDEVAELLSQSEGNAPPRALVEVIQEETSGNPFYAREVFRHLTEESKVRQSDGQWPTGLSLRELGIPEGVREVVGRRVSRLSEATNDLLKLGSGFSGSFGFDVLQGLSDLPEHALLDCVDEALGAGLIREVEGIPPRYEFAHAIVRHTLYEGLNLARRARLHRRIALALERLPRGGEVDAAELAWQYHASAALPGAQRGIGYALRAAEEARAAYAHERAAIFLGMARDLAAESSPTERAEILRKLAVAEAEAVKLEEARQSAEQALEAMDAAGVDARGRAEFLAVVARALKDGGATAPVWAALVERGLVLVGDARDLLWARLALLQDHFEVLQGGPISSGQWLGYDPRAVTIARAEGDEEDYARTLDPLDCRTREETEAVLALARSWSRPIAVMRALDVAGRDLLYRHGAFHEARTVYEELLAAGERFGSIPAQGEALAQIGTSQMATGDLISMRENVRRAQGILTHLGAGHRLQFVAIGRAMGVAYFLEGDWPSVAEAATRYATDAATGRSPVGMVAVAVAALSASRAGREGEARVLLRHFASVVERAALTTYAHSLTVSIAATAVWEIEEHEQAARYRRLTLDLLLAGVGDSPFGPLELWVARMAILLGDFGEAEEYFELARSKTRVLGQTHMKALVDYDEACSLIRAGLTDRARIVGLLDAAIAGFRSHAMLEWASRAVARKETLPTGQARSDHVILQARRAWPRISSE